MPYFEPYRKTLSRLENIQYIQCVYHSLLISTHHKFCLPVEHLLWDHPIRYLKLYYFSNHAKMLRCVEKPYEPLQLKLWGSLPPDQLMFCESDVTASAINASMCFVDCYFWRPAPTVVCSPRRASFETHFEAVNLELMVFTLNYLEKIPTLTRFKEHLHKETWPDGSACVDLQRNLPDTRAARAI